ncbi:hypothetical protein F66182_10590 [Fusarium sp. NRRL 66182]|nr:hypothetical protein F66182_10590 [Fusarium sp. NRRL 66182]
MSVSCWFVSTARWILERQGCRPFRQLWRGSRRGPEANREAQAGPPNLDPNKGPVEAHLVTTAQAKALAEAADRAALFPVVDRRLPSQRRLQSSHQYTARKQQVIQNQAFGRHNDAPNGIWNLLDIHNTIPTRPPVFLPGHRCRLLQLFGTDHYTNDFMLLSQGGSHTGSHVGSHGIGTFITVHRGSFGFGWIASRDEKDLEDFEDLGGKDEAMHIMTIFKNGKHWHPDQEL